MLHDKNGVAAGVYKNGVLLFLRPHDLAGIVEDNLVRIKIKPKRKQSKYSCRMDGSQVLELNLDGDGRFWEFEQDGSPVLEERPEGRPNPENPVESLIYFTPARDDQGNLIGGRAVLVLKTTTTTDMYGNPDFNSKDARSFDVEVLVTTAAG